MNLLSKEESSALCFRCSEDAINYAHHVVEDANRRLADLSLNAVERYVKGDVCLVARAKFAVGPTECDLVFFRVPVGVADAHSALHTVDFDFVNQIDHAVGAKGRNRLGRFGEMQICAADIERNQGAVFLGVTELVQGPEGIIPSLVCLERPKQREDFRWQILASATVDHMLDSSGVVTERKLSTFRLDFSTRNGARVTRLVENGSQIVGSVESDAGQLRWKPPGELDLMNVIASIDQILINNVGPWLVSHKLVDFGVEIIDVMLCARDREARTSEEIAHGGQDLRSDERP